MAAGVWYWIILVIWFLFGVYASRADLVGGRYYGLGGNLVLFVLLGLLGYGVWGSPVK